MTLRQSLVATALFALTGAAAAQQAGGAQQILDRLQQARPDLNYSQPQPSSVPGFFEVKVSNGPTIFVSGDGEYFFAGDVFQVRSDGFVNLAELKRQDMRKAMLEEVSEDDMIVFAPQAEERAQVTVFTDIDCGYCRKLHLEVPELNAMGVTVRYLAYPRAGIGSPSYDKVATAWCAEDPQETLTRLKASEKVAMNVCPDNPVQAQYLLGQRMGLTGTPALVLDDGTMLPGYMPAADLAARLGIK